MFYLLITIIVIKTIAMKSIKLDAYVLDTLMADLVGHDRAPSAFLAYLYLWRGTLGQGKTTTAFSLQEIAEGTGLSKSAVQYGLRTLKRRRLIRAQKRNPTAVPEYELLRPWARR